MQTNVEIIELIQHVMLGSKNCHIHLPQTPLAAILIR